MILDMYNRHFSKNLASDVIETCTEVASQNRRRFSRTVRCSEFRDSRMRADGRCSPLAALFLRMAHGRYLARRRKDGSSYLAQPLPFSISTLIRIKVLVTGYIEFQHNAELYSEAFVPINVV
ncbi:hypothetical protein YC2023_106149 [Brassica napus]